MASHKNKALSAFMILIVIFGCVFLISLAGFFRKQAILGIGLGYAIENAVTMGFSVAAIVRVIWELIKT